MTRRTEADPVRRAILDAMDRLLNGAPRRSQGRLSISQLAVEADLKRWHLTHQHTDLKDLFHQRVAASEAGRAAQAQTVSAHDALTARHSELQKHCAVLEGRLHVYAAAIDALARENAVLRDAASTNVVPLHRRETT
ncbi:hypothetical protein [Embleya sp. NPDC059237]|uniref:hypothetical protein n=1 Tax=Embleya sp. NPDC059237 TaxID=3346784 RepID=UPI0036C7A903